MIKAHLFGGQEHGRVVEIEVQQPEIRFSPETSILDWDKMEGRFVGEFIVYEFDKMLTEEDAAYILKERIKACNCGHDNCSMNRSGFPCVFKFRQSLEKEVK